MNIDELKLNPKNPQKYTKKDLDRLINSIKDFPKMMKLRPIVYDPKTMEVLGGNKRLICLRKLKYDDIPDEWVKSADDLTEAEKHRFIIQDNIQMGEWDVEQLKANWDMDDIGDWGIDIELEPEEEEIKRKLSDRFLMAPFSILDTRRGEWQERKNLWKQLINDKGESRIVPNRYGSKTIERLMGGHNPNLDVSILDPVMCEVMCVWFAPEKANSFDPFAGGAFGYVSSFLGHNYTGIEIRQEQVDLNNERIKEFKEKSSYFCDDGQNISKYIEPNSQDFLFSCPPYFNLEVYSDLENDASNQETYEDFMKIIDNAFTNSIKCLKENRFAAIVVGDIRDKQGYYTNFHEDIKSLFMREGMRLYNEIIMIEPFGDKPIKATRNMNTRKITKVHQNILVFFKPDKDEKPEIEQIYKKAFIFYKGDPKKIKDNFNEINYNAYDIEKINDIKDYKKK